MDNKREIFREFDQIIRNQYDSIPLTDIEAIIQDGENSISFFSRIIRSKKSLKPFHISDFKFYDEMLFISRDIKYYTSLIYFFRPYINDVSIGTYFQSQEDRRYMMFVSICFQSVYNFWDRIGDLLAYFFDTGLKENSIYFGRVIHNFPNGYKFSENYLWLKDNYENKIKHFLGQRDNIVHSYQLECEYYWRTVDSHGKSNELQKIQIEREGFPELFKEQIELTMLGFIKSLKLIEELPNRVYEIN